MAKPQNLLDQFDNFYTLRNQMTVLAESRELYAGIPMPLDGEKLILCPKYPNADAFNKLFDRVPETIPTDLIGEKVTDITVRNIFYSTRYKIYVTVYHVKGETKVRKYFESCGNHIGMDLSTLGCSYAWGIEQEHRALQLLGTLVSHNQFKQYLLTGMFLERSGRSGLTYLFRKLRPTVVLDARDLNGKNTRILATLCLHPIGYYQGSYAGAMCPTDDVIAHLTMMRGDEKYFWRKANQHDPENPASAL